MVDRPELPECPAFPFARSHAYEHPELYNQLQEHGPAAKVTLPTGDVVRLITRFEDAKEILIDRENIYSRKLLCEPDAPWFSTLRPPPGMLTTSDPPENTRLRRLAASGFTARKVKALEPRMQAVTDKLLDDMADMTPPVNLVEALSLPLPIAMICLLLGVPPEGEALVHDWCNSLLTMTAESPEDLMAQQMTMANYILELAKVKRAEPADDLMTTLAKGVDEGTLDDGELIMLIMFLCIAGHETTLSMINGAVMTLLDHPEHKERFVTDPSCVDSYVEELIRVNPIGDGGPLGIVTKDVEIGGVKISAGEAVLVPVGAANRDRRRYEDPAAFVPERDNRDHLGFGGGAHSCLGAPFARAELRIVLTSLFKRFPTLRLAVDREELQLKPTMSLHTLYTLPMTW